MINELQSENLAAGKQFTEDDFQIDDEYGPQDMVEASDDYSFNNKYAEDSDNGQPPDYATAEIPETGESSEQKYQHAIGEEVVVPFDLVKSGPITDNEKKDDVVALRPEPNQAGKTTRLPQGQSAKFKQLHTTPFVKAPSVESLVPAIDSNIIPDIHNLNSITLEKEPHPANDTDTHNNPRGSISPEHTPQASKWKPITIFLSLLCLLSLFWLAHEKNLTNLQTWINNYSPWGPFAVPGAQTIKDSGSPGLQGNNIDASFQEIEAPLEILPNPEKAEENRAPGHTIDRELPPAREPGTGTDSRLENALSSQPESSAGLAPELQSVPESSPGQEFTIMPFNPVIMRQLIRLSTVASYS